MRSHRSRNALGAGRYRPYTLPFSIAVVAFFVASVLPVRAQTGSAAIVGHVTDHMGASLPGVTVSVTGAGNPHYVAEIRSDREGRFVAAKLIPGTYRIRIPASPPFGEAEESVTVDDKTVEVPIALGRGCGRAADTGGTLEENVSAEVVRMAVRRAVERLAGARADAFPLSVSTANVDAAWLTALEDQDLRIMTRQEVRSAAPSSMLLQVTEIRTGRSCSSVSLRYGPARGEMEESEWEITLEYRRSADRWTERIVLEVVS